MDSELNRITTPVQVAGPEDTLSGAGIADHKHIFQGEHHYICFSVSGGDLGAELYLVKLDSDFNRVGIQSVVSDAPPTNDMFMVGDGDGVHVGKFLPGQGHQVYSFDADLQPTGDQIIGADYAWQHAYGASAWYEDGHFVVVAPQTLAPGEGDAFYRLRYDSSWEHVGERKTSSRTRAC
jgi:hypothetical protein